MSITPIEAAEAVGLSTYDFDNLVRDQAAGRLENLAYRVRHGNEAREGDIESDHYKRVVQEGWLQVEAAKVLTEHWMREEVEAE